VEADLKLEWANWLASQPWDYFLTVTFRDQVPERRQESVVHAVGETLTSSHALDCLFLAAEPHLSQNTHLHGLYKAATDRQDILANQKNDVWRVLFNKFGRSKVEVPRGPAHVARYVSKYVVKSSGYYELWGPSRGRLDSDQPLC